MVGEQRHRRLWLETAIIFAAWAVFGLLLTNQSYIQAALGGRQMPLVIALHGAWRHRRHARLVLVGLTASATAILVLLAPVAIAYVRVRREQGFSRTLTDVAAYGASLDAFAHVAPSAWFWGRWLPVGRAELQLFPGLTLPLLALLAVASLRWRRARDRADAAGAPALLPDQGAVDRIKLSSVIMLNRKSDQSQDAARYQKLCPQPTAEAMTTALM